MAIANMPSIVLDEVGAPLEIGVQRDLGVGVRQERVAAPISELRSSR